MYGTASPKLRHTPLQVIFLIVYLYTNQMKMLDEFNTVRNRQVNLQKAKEFLHTGDFFHALSYNIFSFIVLQEEKAKLF